MQCLMFVVFRELIRCLKWYMDRSAEVVRQDHIQEAMRVRIHTKSGGATKTPVTKSQSKLLLMI